MPKPGISRRLRRAILLLGCLLLCAPAPAAGSGEGTWTNLRLPFEREQHTAIYDPIRDRIVVFGGDSGFRWDSDVWVLPLSGPQTWIRVPTMGTPPSPRVRHSAIYDPVRDRMIVFGGSDQYWVRWGVYGSPDVLDDVWALSLSGTPTWSQLAPIGTPPIARCGHSAVYDPVRDRMVVYGGNGYPGGFTNRISDVWALSLSGSTAWTQILPAGTLPPARYGHTTIYDPLRDRMVVFGGLSENGAYDPESNDVWALSLSGAPAWSNLNPVGTPPAVRTSATAIYDPVRDRMIAMGGEFDAQCDHCMLSVKYDTWALSLSGVPAWTKLALPSTGRTEHAALYDPVRDRMLVVGGWDFGVRSEVLALALSDPPAWMDVPDPDPSYRFGHAAIYDPVRARMVMFAGRLDDWHTQQTGFAGPMFADIWALAMTGEPVWALLKPVGTPPNLYNGFTAIQDPLRDRLLVFRTGSAVPNEVWSLSFSGTPTWSQLAVTGSPPSVRSGNSAIYDPLRDRMLIFGGWSGVALNDVWELSLAGTPTWTPLTPSGTPPSARSAHTAVYDPAGDRMVVFGGRDNLGRRNDVWALALAATSAWSEITPAGLPPAAREGHSVVYDPLRGRMVVFGGYNDADLLDDTWALSLSGTPAWVELLGAGAQGVARTGHSAIYDPTLDRMVIFGGSAALQSKNDVWALGLGGATPVAVSLVSARPFQDRVELAWQVDAAGVSSAAVYRREEASAWQSLATVTPDGAGRVTLVDREVAPATRYVYRLGLMSGGREIFSAEASVETPAALGFALLGGRPNPSRGRLSASFTLPAAGPVTLELLDVGGRRVAALEVGGLGAGSHTVDLTPQRALAPGVYLLRLTQGERTATARAAVVK
jgi:hypothetical protein